MPYGWRKEEKHLYLTGTKPVRLTVPRQRFLVIEGAGNPNGADFALRLNALYGLYYTIRMLPKSGTTPEGFYEYSLFPLEGLWDGADDWAEGAPLDKDKLIYRLMIRQPDFVTPEVFAHCQAIAMKKKPDLPVGHITLEDMTDGDSVQLTHIGPYDDEPASFARMDAYARENGLVRVGHQHREIYLGDPRKGDAENLRTVLRYPVAEG